MATNELTPEQEAAATFYMLAALEWAHPRTHKEIVEIAAIAAVLGSKGIRFHDPNSRYQFSEYSSAPISGLQLLSTLYALVKLVAPDAYQGIDLESLYSSAKQMFAAREGGSADANL